MDWNDWQNILRWRALEEGDADGAILSEERRREATARTRGGLTSEDVKGDPLVQREAAFLLRRAQWMDREIVGWSGSLGRILERLQTAEGRWSWAWIGWAVAAVAGYAMGGLGQKAEFNLLALPLVGILLWNAVIMLVSLWIEIKPAAAVSRHSGFLGWLAGLVSPATREKPSEGEALTGLTVDQRFSMLAGTAALERLKRRLRAWMHVAAALLALGSAVGLYARSWSQEYLAVWESTLLSEKGATKFFGGLFGPAARLLNLELPLDQVPGMHRTRGDVEAPAPARPWIHLYAGTLLIMVIGPRLGLAGLTLARAGQVVDNRLRKLGWHSYLKRTLRAVEGGQEVVTLLIHATEGTPLHREVWTRGVRERFGAMIEPEMIHIPLGDEEEFVHSWNPPGGRVVVVFNLATTPEMEVQRRFMVDLQQTLKARHPDASLLVLLDATSIGNRWSPDKTASRERLWTETLENTADDIIIAAQRSR